MHYGKSSMVYLRMFCSVLLAQHIWYQHSIKINSYISYVEVDLYCFEKQFRNKLCPTPPHINYTILSSNLLLKYPPTSYQFVSIIWRTISLQSLQIFECHLEKRKELVEYSYRHQHSAESFRYVWGNAILWSTCSFQPVLNKSLLIEQKCTRILDNSSVWSISIKQHRLVDCLGVQ